MGSPSSPASSRSASHRGGKPARLVYRGRVEVDSPRANATRSVLASKRFNTGKYISQLCGPRRREQTMMGRFTAFFVPAMIFFFVGSVLPQERQPNEELQMALREEGHNPGPIDGLVSSSAKAAAKSPPPAPKPGTSHGGSKPRMPTPKPQPMPKPKLQPSRPNTNPGPKRQRGEGTTRSKGISWARLVTPVQLYRNLRAMLRDRDMSG